MSSDSGDTWSILDDTYREIDHPRGFCVDGDGYLWLHSPCTVFRISLDGSSWQRVYSGPSSYVGCSGVSGVAVRGNTVWVSCWGPKTVAKIDIHTLQVTETYTASEHIESILPATNGDIYISTSSGISVSHDGGYSFDPIHSWSYPDMPMRSLTEVNGTIFYIAGCLLGRISFTGEDLWSSSWLDRLGYQGIAFDGSAVWTAGVDPTTGTAAVRRVDLDAAYAYADTHFDAANISSICVGPSGSIYASLPGALAVSSDRGASWTYKAFGVSTVDTLRAGYGDAWVGLAGGGVAHYRGDTRSWETIVDSYTWGNYTWRTFHFVSAAEVYLGGAPKGSLRKTTDGGLTFTELPYDSYTTSDPYQLSCNGIEEDASGNLQMVVTLELPEETGNIRLYCSSDDGQTWSAPEIVTSRNYSWRSSMALDALRQCTWLSVPEEPLRRQFADGTWQSDPSIWDSYHPCVDSAGTIYVIAQGSAGPGLYLQGLGDHEWTHTDGPVTSSGGDQLTIDADCWIWLGTSEGLCLSTDSGETWSTYTAQDGLASDFVTSLSVEGAGVARTVWVGTASGVSVGSFAP
jgi:hypothetical protein